MGVQADEHVRVCVLDEVEGPRPADFDSHLFIHLAHDACRRGLPRLALATRKLPKPAQRCVVAPPADEDGSALDDDRDVNVHTLHSAFGAARVYRAPNRSKNGTFWSPETIPMGPIARPRYTMWCPVVTIGASNACERFCFSPQPGF